MTPEETTKLIESVQAAQKADANYAASMMRREEATAAVREANDAANRATMTMLAAAGWKYDNGAWEHPAMPGQRLPEQAAVASAHVLAWGVGQTKSKLSGGWVYATGQTGSLWRWRQALADYFTEVELVAIQPPCYTLGDFIRDIGPIDPRPRDDCGRLIKGGNQ